MNKWKRTFAKYFSINGRIPLALTDAARTKPKSQSENLAKCQTANLVGVQKFPHPLPPVLAHTIILIIMILTNGTRNTHSTRNTRMLFVRFAASVSSCRPSQAPTRRVNAWYVIARFFCPKFVIVYLIAHKLCSWQMRARGRMVAQSHSHFSINAHKFN